MNRQRQSEVLTGEQFLRYCAQLKAQGKRIWRVDVVGNGLYRIRGILAAPGQLEFELKDARRPRPIPERASHHTADYWFKQMRGLVNKGVSRDART